MSYARTTGSRRFREAVVQAYSGLEKNPAYWHLMMYLLFPSKFDNKEEKDSDEIGDEDELGNIVISREKLASFEGKKANSNYVGYRFLEAFKRDVVPGFEYTDHTHERYKQGKAREVENTGLGPEAEALRELMWRDLKEGKEDEVVLSTGKKVTRQIQADWRGAVFEQAASIPLHVDIADSSSTISHLQSLFPAQKLTNLEDLSAPYSSVKPMPCFSSDWEIVSEKLKSDSEMIVEYQNGLDIQVFSDIVKKNRETAIQHLANCMGRTERSQHQAWGQLLFILGCPKPMIHTVEKTARLYGSYPSLLSIRKDVRRQLTRGWYEYDLKSAQLAIVAKKWGVTDLQVLLETQGSAWAYLADELGVDLQTIKPDLKTAIYALVFGAEKHNVKRALLSSGQPDSLYEKFEAIPIIQDLFDAREEEIEKIMQELCSSNLAERFGIESRYLGDNTRKSAKQVLARRAQQTELRLLAPVYQLAEPNKKVFKVTLYQFDGFTVSYKTKSITKWESKIKQVVKDTAAQMDIHTELEGGLIE